MKKTFKNEIKNLFDFEKGQLINFYCNNDNCKIINDIFNYYISGYPDIPEEYLYHDEG